MVTLPPGPPGPPEPPAGREVAEGFGADAGRYERARPTYPEALVAEIDAFAPGRRLLDVGCGTGISARPFVERGYQVLGVEPDERMAETARDGGLAVECARIETWDAAGRTFDAVIAGQAWHWVEPVAGAHRVAQVLQPGGVFIAFWNAMQPPRSLATAFADVYAEVLPESPLTDYYRQERPAADVYVAGLSRVEDGLRDTGAFDEPRRWRFDWQREYTADQWLDLVATLGGHPQLPAETLRALLSGIGAAVDAAGGRFAMEYATVATSARRT